jgi:hypothetical protein
MRQRATLLVAATSLLAVIAFAVTASDAVADFAPVRSATTDRAYVDRMLFGVGMATFLTAVGVDRWFDWSTDLCSAPLIGSTGRSFDFRHPCRRHDFGYRNLQLIDRRYGTRHWGSASRKAVDDRFRTDMHDHCRTRSTWLRPTCHCWAEVFYVAVRAAGGP